MHLENIIQCFTVLNIDVIEEFLFSFVGTEKHSPM